MAASDKKIRIPGPCVRFIVICLVGLLAVASVVLYPGQKKIRDLEVESAGVRLEIAKQQLLLPLYVELAGLDTLEVPEIMAGIEKRKLRRDEVGAIRTIFEGIAATREVDVIGVSPRVQAVPDRGSFLVVTVKVGGLFENFRGFLLDAGRLAGLERFERINISEGTDRNEMEMILWFAAGI